jgi:hypothetical protein
LNVAKRGFTATDVRAVRFPPFLRLFLTTSHD